jgi:hypothetical protein
MPLCCVRFLFMSFFVGAELSLVSHGCCGVWSVLLCLTGLYGKDEQVGWPLALCLVAFVCSMVSPLRSRKCMCMSCALIPYSLPCGRACSQFLGALAMGATGAVGSTYNYMVRSDSRVR